jgi:hypothetical protein
MPRVAKLSAKKPRRFRRGLSFVMQGGGNARRRPFETNSHGPSSRYPTLLNYLTGIAAVATK